MGKHPTLALTHTLYASAGADYFGGMSNQGLRIHLASCHVAEPVSPNLASHSLCEGSGHPLPMLGAACFYMPAIGVPTHGDICVQGAWVANCLVYFCCLPQKGMWRGNAHGGQFRRREEKTCPGTGLPLGGAMDHLALISGRKIYALIENVFYPYGGFCSSGCRRRGCVIWVCGLCASRCAAR